jgi:hypothetical protein
MKKPPGCGTYILLLTAAIGYSAGREWLHTVPVYVDRVAAA